ncbi:hypothetical protein MSAN_00757800 [Mycena sanguinolenta]|uniref:Uncharacterized protein n=1 Tax=Mycena sanguinolenta TaxID=230812 RepID=A0A8H6Z6H4_9AGAR|nr:hypothetical protein MSAN_00757800 [Mycena sanguinolenta]
MRDTSKRSRACPSEGKYNSRDEGAKAGKQVKWVLEAKGRLLDGQDMGDDWVVVRDLWWRLEESTGFSMGTKSHPTKGQPKPVEGGAAVMEQEWWGWWTFLNLEWRVRGGALVQEGDGKWEVLQGTPGLNRFFNILMCLRWWYGMMESPSASWRKAVANVKWALQRMVRAEQMVAEATKAPAPPQDAAQPPTEPSATDACVPAPAPAPADAPEAPMPGPVNDVVTAMHANEVVVVCPASTDNDNTIPV